MTVRLKRAYEPPDPDDGFRVLVDRLWPRGITKDSAHLDLWLKEVGPTTELRKWFGHDPSKWKEFRQRYVTELKHNPEAVEKLAECLHHGTVTLVYGAKDEEHNQAVVLKEYLEASGKHPATASRRKA